MPTYPITQPADNAAPYTYTQPIRDSIAGVNDHQTRISSLEVASGGGGGSFIFTADNTGATSVQTALVTQATSAAASGQPLIIPPGDYLFTSAPTDLPVGCTIWAPTRGARFIANRVGNILWVIDGMTIKGITFANSGTTTPAQHLNIRVNAKNVLIEDCTFQGSPGTVPPASNAQGIVANDAGIKNVTIRRCNFDTFSYGILTNAGANDMTGLTIEDCNFTNITGDAIELNHPSATAALVSGVNIHHNNLSMTTYSGASSASGFAIGVAGVRDITISDNIILAARREAIHVEDGSHMATVTGNTIKGVDNTGGSGSTQGIAIYPFDSGEITVANNVVEGVVGGDGISIIYNTDTVLVNNVTITGNIVRNCGSDGIFTGADTTEGGWFLITDNIIAGCNNGIAVTGTLDAAIVHDNMIHDCLAIGIRTETNGGTTGKIRSYRNNIITGTPTDYGATTNGTSVIIPNRVAFVGVSPASVSSTSTVPLMRLGHYAEGLVKFQGRRIGQAGTRSDRIWKIRWNGTVLVAHAVMSRTSGTFSVTLQMINGVLTALVGLGADGVTVECSAGFEGMCSEDATDYSAAGTISSTSMAITGSRGGNAALASLLTALASGGYITDSTSA